MMTQLMLHAGAHAATLDQVREVATPLPDGAWHPIAHAEVLDLVTTALTERHLAVRQSAYALWATGLRMFGTLELVNGENHDDYAMTIGIRNSHDKSFAAGAALGSRVFVCDNLAFSGEITFARKHTVNIARDLPQLVAAGIGRLIDARITQDARIAAYKVREIGDAEAHDVVIRAIDRQVIGPMLVKDVLKEWRAPQHEEFAPRTAWSLFNAFTEGLKGNVVHLPRRSQALHGLMDATCGLVKTDALDTVADLEDVTVHVT